MKLYRFSPIKNEKQFKKAVEYIHKVSHQLCFDNMGQFLPVAGNLAIFAHYEEEYKFLMELSQKLTDQSIGFDNKYFRLHEPIVVKASGAIPSATYEFLYIRQPDIYRSQVGDADFIMDRSEYIELKQALRGRTVYKGARVFPESNQSALDLVELLDPDLDAVSYITTEPMSAKVAKQAAQEEPTEPES